MIFSGSSVDMIAAVEAALIAEYTPLWNAVIDGFGNNPPGGKRMEACARGQLLILAPWEHHNEQLTIRRDQCLKLNDIARLLTTVP